MFQNVIFDCSARGRKTRFEGNIGKYFAYRFTIGNTA